MKALVTTMKLQTHLHRLEHWSHQWRMSANESKSTQVIFTLRREDCPPVYLNGRPIPQQDSVKYLGLHLDRRLNWSTHIQAKRKQLDLLFKCMYWINGRRSELSLEKKLCCTKQY